MNCPIKFTTKGLKQQLTAFESNKFTGYLEIKSTQEHPQWKLYFCLGRIIWSIGGSHPNRSLIRLLAQHCPQLVIEKNIVNNVEKFECRNYRLLTVLLESKKITEEQFTLLTKEFIKEVIFDILQLEAKESLHYIPVATSADCLLASGLKFSHLLVNSQAIFQLSWEQQQTWLDCCGKNFKSWSPNLVPCLQDKKRLEQEVSPSVYQNFVKFIDGQHSLRDLAVKLNQDVVRLSHSLLPYLRSRLIELKEIADLPFSAIAVNSKETQKAHYAMATAGRQFRIACIDDSSQILQVMKQILSQEGYLCFGINEPLQAVPKLISSPPDLIFLDIGMPILNGYEVCAQIRRISKLKETPVIMLTGNDGIVDRVRARVVGASAFLAKPIDTIKLLDTVEKFLPVTGNDEQLRQMPIGQPC